MLHSETYVSTYSLNFILCLLLSGKKLLALVVRHAIFTRVYPSPLLSLFRVSVWVCRCGLQKNDRCAPEFCDLSRACYNKSRLTFVLCWRLLTEYKAHDYTRKGTFGYYLPRYNRTCCRFRIISNTLNKHFT